MKNMSTPLYQHVRSDSVPPRIKALLDGKEIKANTVLTCDVCGDDCSDESYLYDDNMDICPRCFKLDAKSAQQYEDAIYLRGGQPA